VHWIRPRHALIWERLAPPADLAHDGDHLLRVYRWAVRLAPEAGADLDLAGAAALVHDLIEVPKESAQRAHGGELSATASAPLLAEVGYRDDEVAVVVEAVRTSSWSRGLAPTCPEGAVLQDADRLDAIGAIGTIRACTTAHGMASRGVSLRLYDPEDPLAVARAPDDRRYVLDHFRAKLLLLAGGMHTPSAQIEATRRHAFMVGFLDALDHELQGVERGRRP